MAVAQQSEVGASQGQDRVLCHGTVGTGGTQSVQGVPVTQKLPTRTHLPKVPHISVRVHGDKLPAQAVWEAAPVRGCGSLGERLEMRVNLCTGDSSRWSSPKC